MTTNIDNLIQNASSNAQSATAQNQNQNQNQSANTAQQTNQNQTQGQPMSNQNSQSTFQQNQGQGQGQGQGQHQGQAQQFQQNNQAQGQFQQQNPNQQFQQNAPANQNQGQAQQFQQNNQAQGQFQQQDPNQQFQQNAPANQNQGQTQQFQQNNQAQGQFEEYNPNSNMPAVQNQQQAPVMYDQYGNPVQQAGGQQMGGQQAGGQQMGGMNPMLQQQQAMGMQQQPMGMQQQPMGASTLPAHLQGYAAPMEMSMESLDAMGMQVDHWLKPDFGGMMIGDIPSPINSVVVSLMMVQNDGFTLGQGLRYGKEPVHYDFTLDCVTSTKTGQPWMQALHTAASVDSSARPYSAAQLMFDIMEDVTSHDGTVLAKAGESLGYTTPQSNWANWSQFYKLCAREGLLGKRIVVKLTNVAKSKDAYKWGIIKFELATTNEAKTEAKTETLDTQA